VMQRARPAFGSGSQLPGSATFSAERRRGGNTPDAVTVFRLTTASALCRAGPKPQWPLYVPGIGELRHAIDASDVPRRSTLMGRGPMLNIRPIVVRITI
jgi:hypothetical protein